MSEQPPVPAELASPRAAADKIAALEAENAELRASRGNPVVPGGTTRMRVRPPHESMHHGGVTVGQEWTTVPAFYGARLHEAAQDSGVELEEDTEA